jgi:uncharacterized protein YkwD
MLARSFRLRCAALALLALCGLAGCVSQAPHAAGPVTTVPSSPGVDLDASLATLLALHNQERARASLPPLSPSPVLAAAAQRHAADMARRQWMSHRGADFSSPSRRVERAGYSFAAMGENVAAGQTTPEEAMRAWMHSPGHRHNVLGHYSEIGAGVARGANGSLYWCVDFGTPPPKRVGDKGSA